MKSISLALALACDLLGQNPSQCTVHCNTERIAVSSTTVVVNGQTRNLFLAVNAPSGYQRGGLGVASGSHVVRWFPNAIINRKEPFKITGIFCAIRPSTFTITFPFNGYFPETKFHPTLQLSPGVEWMTGKKLTADMAATPQLVLAKTSQTFPAFGNYLAARSFASVSIRSDDLAMSLKYDANGQTTPINDWNPNHQAFPGSASDGIVPVTGTTVQYFDPANMRTEFNDNNQNFSVALMSFFEEDATVNQRSNWGHRRLLLGDRGYSSGTAWSDLAATAGQVGWDVEGDVARAGQVALPLFNLGGGTFPTFMDFLGIRFEVNLGDLNLALLLNAGYVLTLDPAGFGQGSMMNLPALGAASLGATFGVEFVTMLPSSGRLTGSTGSDWIRVVR